MQNSSMQIIIIDFNDNACLDACLEKALLDFPLLIHFFHTSDTWCLQGFSTH